MTGTGHGNGKKQVSVGKGPVILAAAALSHSNPDEPPSRSGSPATAKKPRKDCRITDRFHTGLLNMRRSLSASSMVYLHHWHTTGQLIPCNTLYKGRTNVNVYERSSNARGTTV